MPDKVAPAETVLRPLSVGPENNDDNRSSQGIKLKKELGLLDGVAIIVGIIVGAGIFVSPKGVLENSGSVGQALIIWIFSGILSLIGALCYAELGTMIPKSGGDYAYISDAFGPLPAFLYLWVALFVLVPTGNAITALTFAQYILQPVWHGCSPPYAAVRLLAAVVTCLLTAINCYNVKWATRVQDIFTGTKIFALVIIMLAGFWWLCMGHTENFQNPMAGTNTQPGYIALAVYSGLFSYSGWNYLNFVTEELKDPYKNLPKAICISLPLVTVIYVFANIAYFIVLTQDEILASNAVAVTFGDKMLGVMSWIIPFFVACSTFGALNGAIFASSRLFFVGARNGHLPTAIALINVRNLTPMPSLIFLCIITLVLLIIEDVYALINYVSFVEALFTTLSVSGLLWLRYKRPYLERPIKVWIALPIIFFIICAFLVTVPCYVSPWEVGVGVIVILSGIPVYLIFINWKEKPMWLVNGSHKFNTMCAKLFMCVQEDKTNNLQVIFFYENNAASTYLTGSARGLFRFEEAVAVISTTGTRILWHRAGRRSDGIRAMVTTQKSSRRRASRAAGSFLLRDFIGRPEEFAESRHDLFLRPRGHDVDNVTRATLRLKRIPLIIKVSYRWIDSSD